MFAKSLRRPSGECPPSLGYCQTTGLVEAPGGVLIEGAAARTSQEDAASVPITRDLRDVAKEPITVVRAEATAVVHGAAPEQPTDKSA